VCSGVRDILRKDDFSPVLSWWGTKIFLKHGKTASSGVVLQYVPALLIGSADEGAEQ
jgi:hypothetical protein